MKLLYNKHLTGIRMPKPIANQTERNIAKNEPVKEARNPFKPKKEKNTMALMALNTKD